MPQFIPSHIERSYSDFSQEVERGEERTENQFLDLSGTVGTFSEIVAPSQPESSMSSIQLQAGFQNIEWNEGPFQNTIVGTLRGRMQCSSPPRARSTALIERIRAEGILVGITSDKELSLKAQVIIEDLLFQLQQKQNEVNHLDYWKMALSRK